MGYACPVCEDTQSDAEHLANHAAITAMARGGDHETWLDEHVPEWETYSPAELGERLVEYAVETDLPDEQGHERESELQRRPERFEAALGAQTPRRGRGQLDDETASIVARARELTETMLEEPQEDSSDRNDEA